MTRLNLRLQDNLLSHDNHKSGLTKFHFIANFILLIAQSENKARNEINCLNKELIKK